MEGVRWLRLWRCAARACQLQVPPFGWPCTLGADAAATAADDAAAPPPQADAFSNELDPCKARAESLGRDLERHESELLAARRTNDKLTRLLHEKEAAVKMLKNDLAAAKMKATHQEALLNLFSTDVQAVMAASDEKGSAGSKSERQRGIEVREGGGPRGALLRWRASLA